MNKVTRILYPLILTCLVLLLVVGCTASPTTPPVTNEGEQSTEDPDSGTSSVPADRVDVVYFHRTSRCYSCKYVEARTRYTLETYFKDELASGKVTFQVINVQDKENADIAKKYGAYTSSLFINTLKDGTDHIEEVTNVYSLIGKDEAFAKALKSKIEKSLTGDV